jgi:transcriptional regulator with XRE-family HTH domain
MKGEQLKKLRKKIGLSQAQAADQVHVALRTWYRWEAGERRIPESVVELFCTKNKIGYPPPSN